MPKYILYPLVLLLLIAGCGNPVEDGFDALDGNAGFIASEVADMSEFTLQTLDGTVPKVAAVTAETVYVEVDIDPWRCDTATYCWVRRVRAQYEYSVRERTDSVYFYDALGNLLNNPGLDTVCSLRHVREVTQERNQHTARVRLQLQVAITNHAGEMTAVKNGTGTGTFEGNAFKMLQVTNVVRRRINNQWQFPESGAIHIDRQYRSIDIEYTGDGTAQATVTRKRDRKTYRVQVNISTGEES